MQFLKGRGKIFVSKKERINNGNIDVHLSIKKVTTPKDEFDQLVNIIQFN